MITKQELYYASVPAYNAPYPGDDYAYDTINNLSYCCAIYRRDYEGKKYKLILSNGEKLEFEIKPWNLPHLLGIDYRMITSLYMKPLFHNVLELCDEYKINSLVVLNRIIENADKVLANDEINPIKILNYYKIMLKTSCFLKFSKLKDFDFGVLDFNKNVYKNISNNYISSASNKYLFSKTNEELAPYCMIGLKYDNNLEIMVPETLVAPYDMADYLYGQRLILPLELLITNGEETNRVISTREDKIRILNFYKLLLDCYHTDIYINGFKEVLSKKK